MRPQDAFPILRAQTEKVLTSIANENVKVHTLSREQRRAWQVSTARAVDQIIRQIGGRSTEIYDLVLAEKRAYAEKQRGNGEH